MKKFPRIFFGCILLAGVIACVAFVGFLRHHSFYRDGHDVSLRINESDEKFQVSASYHRGRTHKIQRYLDSKLQTHIFRNSKINATVTLDDNTRVYVKNVPGRLVIKLNRDENSFDAYLRIKELAEGLKLQITD